MICDEKLKNGIQFLTWDVFDLQISAEKPQSVGHVDTAYAHWNLHGFMSQGDIIVFESDLNLGRIKMSLVLMAANVPPMVADGFGR